MVSWEKATCPLAALSLHYQPTKNSFHSLFAPFSLTLFLSLYLPSQLTSCALNSSQQWTSYSVRESENMSSNSGPNDIRSPKLKKNIKSILVTVFFRGVFDLWDLSEFTFCTDRSLTYHVSLCAFVYFTLRVWKLKCKKKKKKLKAREAALLEQRLQRDFRTAFTVQEWPESQKHHAIEAKPSANELSVTR